VIVPNIAIPTSAMHATLAATIGLRSTSNGRIGSRARSSTRAKAANIAAAIANAPSTWPLVHA
jgi:hypothetical protein